MVDYDHMVDYMAEADVMVDYDYMVGWLVGRSVG